MRPATEKRSGITLVLPKDRTDPDEEITVEKARRVHAQRERAWDRYPAGKRPACPSTCTTDLLPVPLEEHEMEDQETVLLGALIWNSTWVCPSCHLIADHRGRDLRGTA